MSTTLAAVIIIAGLAFVATSIWLRFAKKLRIIIGVLVGICISGLTLTKIRDGAESTATWSAHRIAQWVGEDDAAIAGALVCGTTLILVLIVINYLKGGGGGGHGGGRRGGLGHAGGGHGGSRIHPHLALAAALTAPILVPLAVEILGTIK